MNLSSGNERLSYLQSNEPEQYPQYGSTVINPCKSLTDVFNSVYEEEIETEQLRVYLRIRPLLNEETIVSKDGNIEIINPKSILLTAPSNSHGFKNNMQGVTKLSHRFKFTHVYNEEIKQKVLFEETTENLVKDLINGQNCLLFTYGATNSGKTYTIQGTSAEPGLLPQSLDTLFRMIGTNQFRGIDLRPQHFCGVVRMTDKESKKEIEIKEGLLKDSLEKNSFSKSSISLNSYTSQDTDCQSPQNSVNESNHTIASDVGSTEEILDDNNVMENSCAIYAIFVSFAEIYNEYIYDLLEKHNNKIKRTPLALGEDKNGCIYIKGLKELRVTSTEEAMQVLEVGKQNLHFAATKLNHQSSRSHCIFTIKVIRLADPDYPHVARVSMLSLCDLAGAERAGKTLNSKDRLKEANNINTSLLVLGRCMAALRQNQFISKHNCGPKKSVPIPYRDSKVTRLFQSFFIGRGKVAMIVNISASSLLYDETLTVLKFSALASKVTITQEKLPLEQQVQEKKSSNQFSRFMRHSLNMSTSSGRLSVPWSNKSITDVTFGGVDENDRSQMLAVPEEEDEDNDDERYEALLQLINKLKERLLIEVKEKAELEDKLRKELCDVFSKRIVQIEDTWKNRFKEQNTRNEEFMEWRINHLLNSMKKPSGGRKRIRTEDVSFNSDDDEEKVPSIFLAREEIKVQNLSEENAQLKDELEALKASLKASSQTTKAAQEENSKLVFKLADITRTLNEIQKEKDDLQMSLKHTETLSNECEDGDILKSVVRELQSKVAELQDSEERKDQELKNVKDLLVEAAEEYHEKEQLIQSLKNQVEAAKDLNTNQSLTVSDYEKQLQELKSMFASQGAHLEDREQEIDELRKEIDEILKVQSDFGCTNRLQQQILEKEDIKNLENRCSEFVKLIESSPDKKKKEYENLIDINKKLEEENEKYINKLNENELKIDELYKNKDATNSQLRKIIEKNSNLETKIKESLEERKNLEKKIFELTNKLESLAEEDKSSSEELTQLIKEKNSQTEVIESLERQTAKLQHQIESLEETVTLKDLAIKELWKDLGELRESNDKLNNDNKGLKSTLEVKTETEKCLNEEKNKLEEDKIKLEEDKIKLEDDKMKLQDDKIKYEQKNFKLDDELQVMKTQINTLNCELDETKIKLDSAKNEKISIEIIKDLKNKLNKENEKTKTNQSLIELLKVDLKVMENSKNDLNSKLENLEKRVVYVSELRNDENASYEETIKKQNINLENLEGMNTNLEQELNNAQEKAITYKKELEIFDKIKEENIKLKEMLAISCKKEKDLEELHFKSKTEIHNLSTVVEEKDETVGKMAAKIESLDKKVDITEEKLMEYKTKCEVLEKEVAALREARIEESGQLKLDVEQKDHEITSLQQEIKKLLSSTASSVSTENVMQTTIKSEATEEDDLVSLQNKMTLSEQENEKLKKELLSLQEQIRVTQEKRDHQSPDEQKRKTNKKVSCRTDVIEIDSATPTPCKSSARSSTRKKNARNNPLISIENATPESLRLNLDTSDGEDLSVTKKKPIKTRRGRTVKSKTNILETSFEEFKVPSAHKYYGAYKTLNRSNDETDDWEPESATKKTEIRKTKSRSKKVDRVSKVYNPHLEKENKANADLTSLIEEKLANSADSRPTRTRSRRQRQLYSAEDEPFECTPDLIQFPSNEDSPHTSVRRFLRSKTKGK